MTKKPSKEEAVARALQSVARGIRTTKPHMLDMLAYVRGADAPDEMRKARDPEWELNTLIERVITMGKDAHDAISVGSAYSDEDAMHSLHDAAAAAHKAIAILRKRTPR